MAVSLANLGLLESYAPRTPITSFALSQSGIVRTRRESERPRGRVRDEETEGERTGDGGVTGEGMRCKW